MFSCIQCDDFKSSGLFYQDVHQLVKIAVIFQMIRTQIRRDFFTGDPEQGVQKSPVILFKDLEQWSQARLCPVNIPESGCIWAPEAVYEEEKEQFFVYFSVWVGNKQTENGKHKIYACHTKDFKVFTEPFIYMERDEDVIDTTIVKSENQYFRISKNESAKKLILEEGKSLTGAFSEIRSEVLEQISGIEGPECYQLPDGRWCLIADQYQDAAGYFPMVTKDLHSGKFEILKDSEYFMGDGKMRHGGVLRIK